MKFLLYVFLAANVLGACTTSYIKNGDNEKEGFSNKKIIYRDYSTLNLEYSSLKGILLKTDDKVQFEGTVVDSLYDKEVVWQRYTFKVKMKLVESWDIAGWSTRKPSAEEVIFELLVDEKNAEDVFKTKKELEKNDSRGHFNLPNYKSYTEGNYSCNGSIIYLSFPFDENLKEGIGIYTPNKIVKLKVLNLELKRANSFALSYVTYNLTRGIAFLIGNKTCEIDRNNINFL